MTTSSSARTAGSYEVDPQGSFGFAEPDSVGFGLAQPSPTWSVSELHNELDGIFRSVFADEIWVEGEIRNMNRSKNGHVYFDLVDSERATENYPPVLAITLFKQVKDSVNAFLKANGGGVRVNDGVRVRIRGNLRLYPARSSIQLRMTGIDAQFTLGVLEQQRQKVLAALEADGLLDLNSNVPLSPVPFRVALVTSIGSAAYADALHELEGAGLGLDVKVFDARVQGADAGKSVAAALKAACSHDIDLILLVRGGGAKTDLAAFDLEPIARAIATATVPVFTGIGHEVDTSIADTVAHSAFKTPTAAAAGVCDLVRAALDGVEWTWERVADQVLSLLTDHSDRTTSLTTRIERSCTRHLNRRDTQIQSLAHGLRVTAVSKLAQTSMLVESLGRRTSRSASSSLDLVSFQLDALAARARSHDPVLALARGWSITRSSDGSIIRSVHDVQPGQTITTRLADGAVQSLVESTAQTSQPGTDT